MNGKRFWLSKTFWVNVLAIAGLLVQTYTGFVIDADKQALLLAAINGVLRFTTKEPIGWSAPAEPPPAGDQANG